MTLKVDPASFGFMNNLPIYRLTFATLGLFGYLLRVTLSVVMVRLAADYNFLSTHVIQTMVVAILSVRRYLLKYTEPPYVPDVHVTLRNFVLIQTLS